MKSISLSSSLDLTSLKSFVKNKILPETKVNDGQYAFPIETYRQLHALGWLQSPLSTEWGGVQASTSDLLGISRELAYGSCGIFTSTLGHWLTLTALMEFASQSLQQKVLGDLGSRFSLASFCMTEPDAGTDVMSITTTAQPVDQGYRLSGKKCFITNANYSEHLVVFAKIEGHGKGHGISAFYLPANSPGVTRGVPLKKLGQRESNTSEIYFEQVFVPRENLLAQAGDGLKILRRCIQRSKTLIAGGAVGAATRAFEITGEYLNQRKHYGTTLLKLHTVNSQLAQLHTRLDASWLLACLAAATWDQGESAIKEASMAKYYASDMAAHLTLECLELFGGYGYANECEIEKIFRDVRAFEIVEGASLVQLNLIAKEIFPGLLDPITVRTKAA